MKMKMFIILFTLISLFTNCMTQKLVLKNDGKDVQGRVPDAEVWSNHLVLGFIPLSNQVNAGEICAGKIQKVVDEEQALADQPWNLIIGGFWYSRTISVYCAK